MPDPGKYKNKQKFISDCIPMVLQEGGKNQEQAAGKCYGMWKNRKKKKKSASDIVIEQVKQLNF